MKRTVLYRIVRKIYRLSKRVYYLLKHLLTRRKERLLFVFGGRTEGWPGVARGLYNDDPDFAASIQYCNSVLIEKGGSEILSYFEGPLDENYFDDELKFSCITVIQVCIVDLLNKKGIYPNAVLGISMGEIAAAYAAGGLSLEDSLSACLNWSLVSELEKKDYTFLFIILNMQAAIQLCKESPVWLEVVFEDGPNTVITAFRKADMAQLEAYLNGKQVSWKLIIDKTYLPYHTSLIKAHKEALININKDLNSIPLRCDYYSSARGELIVKNSVLGTDYWYELINTPVLFNSTLQTAVSNGNTVLVQIGPPAFSHRQLSSMPNAKALKLFNTFQFDAPSEIQNIKSITRQLLKTRVEAPSPAEKGEAKILDSFLQTFNLHSLDQNNQLEYLRKNGPIHFLPVHNAWLILGYNNTEHILKNPDIYSTSVYDYIDPVLIGADPTSHKIVRDILQPLFSSQAIADMAKATLTTADDLLDSLLLKDEFDMVLDFSDPLSQTVLCSFLGFTPSEETTVREIIGVSYHNTAYWQNLGTYFINQFDLTVHAGEENVLGKLQLAVDNAQFNPTDAALLLRIILTAGIATTSTLISTTLNVLHKAPQFEEQIKDNDQLIAKYIEECLRLETPAHYVRRITTAPVELAGKQLPTGTYIYINLRSANRDPEHFADPDTFSISRPAKRHLAFGTGIHQCIGMGMARAEARSAMQVVLAKQAELKPYHWEKPQYFKDSEIQAMTSLKLKK